TAMSATTLHRSHLDDTATPTAAIAMVCGTYALFSVLDAAGKYLVGLGFAPAMVVWVRFAVHGIILIAVLKAWSNPQVWAMARPGLQMFRSTLLPATTLLNFAALQFLQLDQTVAIFLATPLAITALAGPILGEWAGPRRWAAVLVGFVGVLIVVRPGSDVFTPPILLSVGAMLTYGLYSVMTRKLANSETQQSLNFYPTLFGSLLMLPLALLDWRLPTASLEISLFLLTGLVGLTGHLLLIMASKLTAASKLAPFQYTQLLWMVGLGYFVFGDVPDGWTALGASVIVASGLYLLHRERGVRRQAAGGS
ncbi:MAG: DMT family transporter, partial [Pseudomonadota bacterium]